MSSSTSSSDASPQRMIPAIAPHLCGAVAAMMIVLGGEWLYRQNGGMPKAITPGLTRIEYQWKMSRLPEGRPIVFVGDSRVGWGFAERAFQEQIGSLDLGQLQAVNAGLAATSSQLIIDSVLDQYARREPGLLVVNFSPVAIYRSPGRDALRPVPGLKLQDVIDERIANSLRNYIYTFDINPKQIIEQALNRRVAPATKRPIWIHRKTDPDGFVNATLAWSDGSEMDSALYQVDYYRTEIEQIAAGTEACILRKKRFEDSVRRAREQGWQVLLVRLPLGPRLRDIEDRLPESLLPDTIARELNLRFIDYNRCGETRSMATLDESHLTPGSARSMAGVLARDIAGLFRDTLASEPSPLPSRATARAGVLP